MKGGLQTTVIGEDTENPENDGARLLDTLTNEGAKPAGELWLVFIGHVRLMGAPQNLISVGRILQRRN